MDFVVDNYQFVLECLQEEFEYIESQIFGDMFDCVVIEWFYMFKCQFLCLCNVVLLVEDIVGQFVCLYEDVVFKELCVYFCDIVDYVYCVVGVFDVICEMLIMVILVNVVLVLVMQNDIVKCLVGWGVILVILIVVFSNYGMNFKGMLELEYLVGYFIVLVCMVIVCVWLYCKLCKLGWIQEIRYGVLLLGG